MADKAGLQKLGYYEQWQVACRSFLTEGDPQQKVLHVLHGVLFVVHATILAGITYYQGSMLAREDLLVLVMKNTICYTYLIAFLGLHGMYQGFFTGEPNGRLSLRPFQIGTGAERLMFFKSILPPVRTIVDVILSVVLVVSTVNMLYQVDPSTTHAALYCVSILAQMLLDYAHYLGSDGYYHGPLSVALLCASIDGQSKVVGIQIFLFLLYFNSGVGKLAPWFSRVFASEWTTPVWAIGNSALLKMFFVDPANNNFQVTVFARVLAAIAAIIETLAPVCLLVTPDCMTNYFHFEKEVAHLPVLVGLFAAFSMHVYIVLHLPAFDVNWLNTTPAILLLCSYYFLHYGFDYEGLNALPLYGKVYYGILVGYCCCGQINTHLLSYVAVLRFWAGNWGQYYFVFTKSGQEKYKKYFKHYGQGPPFDNLVAGGIVPEAMRPSVELKLLSFMFLTQLCGRPGVKLIKKVIKNNKLTDDEYQVYGGFFIAQHLFGTVGNCNIRGKSALESLQYICNFDEGEVTLINCNAFPAVMFGRKSTWQIVDAKKGVVEEGIFSLDYCLHHPNPLDWENWDCNS
eukprot:m.8007 g.8007  ORF g.8007 m.8007 type:complete len:570 (+) comp3817_c0_seq2:161-1870(+)